MIKGDEVPTEWLEFAEERVEDLTRPTSTPTRTPTLT
jgi:hypothetical protein